MLWVIVQLTPWAFKTKSCNDIKKAVKRYKLLSNLDVYCPIHEDDYGKKDVGFGEYIFIEYLDKVDYSVLEGSEDFSLVLKTAEDNPHILTDKDVMKVKSKCVIRHDLSEGDKVRILHGEYRGNIGIVQDVGEGLTGLSVTIGHDIHQVTLADAWIMPLKTTREINDL